MSTLRALIVTNMYPTPERPSLGSFVADQVAALRRLPDLEVEVFAFEPGGAGAYLLAARELHRRYRHRRFEIVHAHFGLSAWPSLAARAGRRVLTMHGTDLAHPRSRPITLAVLRLIDLPAAVSSELAGRVPRWAVRRPPAVLPCGVDLGRFHPIPRAGARSALGLDPERPCLLFAADPRRAEKRYDRAQLIAGEVPLHVLGAVDPHEVPLWVNAANAVLVPSEREGFGLAVLEALACDVPVLATPCGIAAEALAGIAGALCEPFHRRAWSTALAPHLASPDPRIAGRSRAERFSTDRMATRVLSAWRDLYSDDRG
ncbi:MAG: glycosyltransferase [Solirubrobacteraceae bacterium]